MATKNATRAVPVLSYRQVSQRLRALHAQWVDAGSPDEWRYWYQDQAVALAERADTHGLPLCDVILVAAALSPRRRWSANLTDVDMVLGGCGPDGFKYTKANYWRAVGALLGHGIGNGPKVRAFAANLAGDWGRVTIDSWMLQCVGWPEGRSFTDVQYGFLSDQIARVARSLDLTPAELQALTWCAARGSAV
jgi:hypothetical protein